MLSCRYLNVHSASLLVLHIIFFSCYLYLQLRNLVWSTSKHDVYLMSDFSVIHWSSLSSKKTEVLNVFGHVAPCEVHLFLRSYFESFQLWALGFLFRKYSWTDISLTETPWKFTGRIYSNTSKHSGCPWQFVDCWGIPGRAHLQGNSLAWWKALSFCLFSVLNSHLNHVTIVFVVVVLTYCILALLMQYLDRPGITFCTKTTYDDNAITNAIEIYDAPR